MAILDLNLILSSNQAITVTAPSTGVIDMAGVGIGNAPPNAFGVSNSVFGQDIGIGDGMSPPNLTCIIGTAFVGGTSLNVQIQASVDSGAPSYNASNWETIVETGALLTAVLTAGTKIAEYTIPPRAPGQSFPRFYRLNYVVVGTFSAGTIGFAGIATGRDDTPSYPAAY
jgi:hypothetical protein